MKTSFLTLCLLCVFAGWVFAQRPEQPVISGNAPDPDLSITKHTITLNGEKINYTATAGYLPQRDETGKVKGNIFFVAYTRDGVLNPATRPITYTYNGGPGSASVWLHMGALGPKRILMGDDGRMLAPPYTVADNEFTWLAFTDLVFIDPVMTGYSRPAEGIDKKEFTGYTEDIQSVGDFIRLYTTRYDRWASPKFLSGESYGTTRSAGLSGYLQDRHGLFLNGIVLISAVLDFATGDFFISGNELPYSLFLPTYAAMAWYHKQVPAYSDLKTLLAEVEKYAIGDYTLALMKGDRLTPAERQTVAAQLSKFTGLSTDYLQRCNLRIRDDRFTKELLRKQGKTVGRLDGRFIASDYDRAGETYEFDPSYNATIYGPFTTAVNDHLHRVLKVKNDLPYEILTGRVRPWSYANVQNQFLNTAETLRQAMTKNPYLKVHVCNGYYDMATPYFATDYTFAHMMLDPALKANVTQSFYEAGHMMYIDKPALIQMTRVIADFYKSAGR
ncbi:S10 family peptidase [Spirosoma montaniterrae]|uniref:S10 family peptidase n=1 Tax=Spirosoma montaniterrae TaxID=1178516 RepID=UPI0009FB7E94|nr:peptidase S10 [Spirosoma montaniterrae]